MDYKKFLELCQRGQTGKQVEKSDWDLDYVIDTVMELNDEYEFSWDKQVIIPEDEQLFRDMFEASKKLIQQIGMYNLSTQRVISFTEEEIEQTDLADGGQAGDDQIDRDHQHAAHGDQPHDEEQAVYNVLHKALSGYFHDSDPLNVYWRGSILQSSGTRRDLSDSNRRRPHCGWSGKSCSMRLTSGTGTADRRLRSIGDLPDSNLWSGKSCCIERQQAEPAQSACRLSTIGDLTGSNKWRPHSRRLRSIEDLTGSNLWPGKSCCIERQQVEAAQRPEWMQTQSAASGST